MTEIYIITWSYGDGSGFGVIRAFADIEAANDLLTLLKVHADTKTFTLHKVPFVGVA